MFELIEKTVGTVGCLLFGHHYIYRVRTADEREWLSCAHCPKMKDARKRRHRDSVTISVITTIISTILFGYIGWWLGTRFNFDVRLGAIFSGFIGVAVGFRLAE